MLVLWKIEQLAELVVNTLLIGYITVYATKIQVIEIMKKMAKVVDEQNIKDKN